MLKYLGITIKTESREGEVVESVKIVAADDILYCESVDNAVRLYLKGASSYIELEYKPQKGRDVEGVSLVEAINNALISAAETTWTQATSNIIVPPGLLIVSFSIKQVTSESFKL